VNSRLSSLLSKSGLELPAKVRKRDGSIVEFDFARIEKAVESCYADLQHQGTIPATPSRIVAESAATAIASKHAWAGSVGHPYPSVEQIQDLVEISLLAHHEVDAARAYMSYRDARSNERGPVEQVPAEVSAAFELDARYFPTPMQRFAFYDKYSRYNWDLERRETWPETVDRTIEHLKWEVYHHTAQQMSKFGELTKYAGKEIVDIENDDWAMFTPMKVSESVWERLRQGILSMKVMPSMRLLAMAGRAARRNSISIYNCSTTTIDSIDSLVEILVISMSGCGVGFSVERANVEKFPRVKRQTGKRETWVVEDTTEGWADALRAGLTAWWSGTDIDFDVTWVRPAGAILRTKGGRASGPAPLVEMLDAIRSIILAKQGSFLGTTDAHLLACWVGEAAVAGGTRRTAMISYFDWDDQEMRRIKNAGAFWDDPLLKVLGNANNSAVWPSDISDLDVMNQMTEMMFAGSGEPGIFSRDSARKTMPPRRLAKLSEEQLNSLASNPCGEIFLLAQEFCNLSQAISRPGDTEDDLAEKIELATILGTIQSLSTRFPGLRPGWKANCEAERLLGVDLTAQNDCELLRADNDYGDFLRARLAGHAVEVNTRWAETFGINPSAAITCNKPAGNSTGFIGAAGSGIHRAFAPFYVRRMTVGTHTPQFRVLRAARVPMTPYAGQEAGTATRWWAEFPIKAPAGTPLLRDASAVEQCEFWLLNKLYWTEHNPSCTISYRLQEAVDLVKWVAEHKDYIGGLSFLPVDDTVYPIMPFTEISEDEYNRRIAEFPEIDYSLLYLFEKSDMSEASITLACMSGSCEIP
jgi:ribonucleoside-triphosphate reductase